MPPHKEEYLLPHERIDNHIREPTHAEIFDKLKAIEEILRKLENRI